MSFKLAHSLSNSHLIVQPSDLDLNPPQSYLFIQDFLIIACGTLYLLCYLFYITRTIRDRRLAGPVEYMSSTMSYEIFYAIATTSTTFERVCFMAWFAFDLAFVGVAIRFAYPAAERRRVAARTAGGTMLGLMIFWALARKWPDEREQLTGFWTGILLQLPINWGSLWVLVRDQSTKGHSLEIWITRYVGCIFAYAVFIWRYLNVPENWSYVGSKWSWWIMGLTLLPETVFPFIYLQVHRQQERREGALDKKKSI